MRTFLFTILGVVIGLACSLLFVYIVGVLYPLITGTGSDKMTQGILGWIVLVFAAPIFAVVGGIIGFKKS